MSEKFERNNQLYHEQRDINIGIIRIFNHYGRMSISIRRR